MKNIRLIPMIIALVIPLAIGGISAFISRSGMEIYGSMNKPPLSPPAWLFPVAWTILYIVMGLASYFIYTAQVETRIKVMALVIYVASLFVNFMWSIIFFNLGEYLVAFLWLMLLWCLVILCAIKFYPINKLAGYLMIPYILWLTFAGYLNMGAFILSR